MFAKLFSKKLKPYRRFLRLMYRNKALVFKKEALKMNVNALVKRAKNGDPDAFVELMEQNKSAMYKTAVSILHNDADAADAIQDAVLSCWKNIGKLRQEKYFKTWLTRILINCCKDIIRKNGNTVYLENYDGIDTGTDTSLSDRGIKESFEGLSDNYRLILTLYYTQGMTIKEISELLDMKENTVKTRLSRGRAEFKMIYTDREAVSV